MISDAESNLSDPGNQNKTKQNLQLKLSHSHDEKTALS